MCITTEVVGGWDNPPLPARVRNILRPQLRTTAMRSLRIDYNSFGANFFNAFVAYARMHYTPNVYTLLWVFMSIASVER